MVELDRVGLVVKVVFKQMQVLSSGQQTFMSVFKASVRESTAASKALVIPDWNVTLAWLRMRLVTSTATVSFTSPPKLTVIFDFFQSLVSLVEIMSTLNRLWESILGSQFILSARWVSENVPKPLSLPQNQWKEMIASGMTTLNVLLESCQEQSKVLRLTLVSSNFWMEMPYAILNGSKAGIMGS